jgi:mRNA interferase MazF
MSPTRGEVWWHEPPDAKPRPVVILTRDGAIDVLNVLIVAPATRNTRDIPTHVYLDKSDGMQGPCALSLDNISTVPKGYLTRRITALAPHRLTEICRALSAAVSC